MPATMNASRESWVYMALIVTIAAVMVLPPVTALGAESRGSPTASVNVPTPRDTPALNPAPAGGFGAPSVATTIGVLGFIPVGSHPYAVAVDNVTGTIYVANEGSNNVSVIDSASNTIIATVPTGLQPWGIAVDSGTDTIFVTNSGSNDVSVIDGATNTVTATIPVGTNPIGIAVDSATGRVYVVNKGSDNVSVINETTQAVTATFAVGYEPWGVCVDSVTDTLYVTNSGWNSVSVINATNNSLTTQVSVQLHPTGIAVNDLTDVIVVANSYSSTTTWINGHTNVPFANSTEGLNPQGVGVDPATDTFYITSPASNNMSIYDQRTRGHVVVSVGTRNPWGVAVDDATDTVYVAGEASDVLSVVDGGTNHVVNTVRILPGQAPMPGGVAVNSETDRVYVLNTAMCNNTGPIIIGTCMSVLNGTTDAVVATVPLNTEVRDIVVDSRTNTIYVSNVNYYEHNVSVINGTTNKVMGNFTVGSQPLGIAVDSATDTLYAVASLQNNLSVVDCATGKVTDNISVGSTPVAVAVDSATDTIYVSNSGSNTVSVIDGATNTVTATIPVGEFPGHIAVDTATDTIYVAHQPVNTMDVIDGATNTVTTTIDVPLYSSQYFLIGVTVDTATDTIYATYYNGYYTTNNGSLIEIDGHTNSVSAIIPMGLGPDGVALDTRTDTLFVSNQYSWTLDVVNVSTGLWVPPPTVAPASVDSGQSVTFSGNHIAKGMLPYSYAWSGLPSGCASTALSFTCIPSATALGPYSVNLTVTDSLLPSPRSRTSGATTLTIFPDPAVTAAPTASPSSTDLGQAVTFRATVANPGSGGDVYSWSGLPSGCLSANALSVTCVPTAASTYTVTFRVNDSNGGNASSPPLSFTVSSDPAVPTLTATRTTLDVGQSTVLSLKASNGTGLPSTYAWSGLPAGCPSQNATSISCSPATAGTFLVNASIQDSNGKNVSSSTIVLVISPALGTASLSASRTTLDVGQSVTLSTTIGGGDGVYGYAWSNLPAGCAPANTSVVVCVPNSPGGSTVTVVVTDSNGANASATVNLTVSALPTVSSITATRTQMDVGQTTALSATATNGTGVAPTHSWSGLPTGCASSNTLKISCTPTAPGTYTVTVSVNDSNGGTVTSAPVVLTVSPALSTPKLTSSVSTLKVGQSVVFTVTVSGGSAPLSYAWKGLPTGCSSADSQVLACEANATGTYTAQVTVSDGAGASVSASASPVTVTAATSPSRNSSSLSGLELGLMAAVGFLVILVVALMAYILTRKGKKGTPSGETPKPQEPRAEENPTPPASTGSTEPPAQGKD